MTKRFVIEPTARKSEPFRVRDTQTNVILRDFTNLSEARVYEWQRNAYHFPKRRRLLRWLTRTPVDEHAARRQRIAERCEAGQRRISEALKG